MSDDERVREVLRRVTCPDCGVYVETDDDREGNVAAVLALIRQVRAEAYEEAAKTARHSRNWLHAAVQIDEMAKRERQGGGE